MICYPQHFYTHHDPDQKDDVDAFTTLNIRLLQWKDEFLKDQNTSIVKLMMMTGNESKFRSFVIQ
jgi:hypothetical protein